MPRPDHLARIVVAAAVAIVISPAATAQPTNQIFIYREACDGSAAAALGQNEFAVADDDSNVLRIYRIEQTKPAWSLPIDKFLGAPPKKKGGFKEADIEGAARIGDRIYWIGSHGRDSKGNAEPSRARFFATRVVMNPGERRLEAVGSELTMVCETRCLRNQSLRLDCEVLRTRQEEQRPRAGSSDNGFNIEGLASTADGIC